MRKLSFPPSSHLLRPFLLSISLYNPKILHAFTESSYRSRRRRRDDCNEILASSISVCSGRIEETRITGAQGISRRTLDSRKVPGVSSFSLLSCFGLALGLRWTCFHWTLTRTKMSKRGLSYGGLGERWQRNARVAVASSVKLLPRTADLGIENRKLYKEAYATCIMRISTVLGLIDQRQAFSRRPCCVPRASANFFPSPLFHIFQSPLFLYFVHFLFTFERFRISVHRNGKGRRLHAGSSIMRTHEESTVRLEGN